MSKVKNIPTQYMNKNKHRLRLYPDRIEGIHMGVVEFVMPQDHPSFQKFQQIIINSQGYKK